jgi:2Fe-2S ferredoxin
MSITVFFWKNIGKNTHVQAVEVPEGSTIMEAAKFFAQPSIEEIPATCGGTCSCGTCHVHIGNDWVDKLPKIDYNTPEIDLLEYQKNYKADVSRLGCQIKLTKEHNGIVINLLDDELL